MQPVDPNLKTTKLLATNSCRYFVNFVMAWDNKTPETTKTFRLSERLHVGGTKQND